MVVVTVIAVVLFGAPLALAAARLYRGREVSRLEREATRAAGTLPATGLHGEDPIELPTPPAGVQLALYEPSGQRVIGAGPQTGGVEVASALRGHVTDHHAGRWLAVAVPLHDEEQVVGAARAALRWNAVVDETHTSWLLMAALALSAVALAGALAWWQSSRLVAPVEGMAALAARLGDGDFTVRLQASGVAEVDRTADALNHTARRLGDLVAAERTFAADVSHQLNTPLTSLRLALESALVTPGADPTAAIEDAVGEVERLQATVSTLLAVTRDTQPLHDGRCDAARVCGDAVRRWHGALAAAGRPLRAEIEEGLPEVGCPADVLREILNVLTENACVHGAGTVIIAARRAGTGVVVDVGDEGSGVGSDVAAIFTRRSARAAGHGIGLALARSLAQAHGARLEVTRAGPQPVFSVALPARRAEPPDV
jgi:signal transduction histidine kinase